MKIVQNTQKLNETSRMKSILIEKLMLKYEMCPEVKWVSKKNVDSLRKKISDENN